MDDTRTIRRFPVGEVTPPPSKSYAHRAVLAAALATRCGGDESLIRNVELSQDINATLRGASALGCSWEQRGSDLLICKGHATSTKINCGESGSTLRFLIPIVVALNNNETTFTGEGRLLQRPLTVYDEIFRQAGTAFSQNGNQVTIRGLMKPGNYHLPGDVSSQFITGLLFALPLLEGDSQLHLTTPLESQGYVDMTVEVLLHFGVKVTQSGPQTYHIPGNQKYRAGEYMVESDYSQSAYFLGAAALGCPVTCRGLNPESLQGDRAILNILEEMGATLTWRGNSIMVTASQLHAITVDARQIPDLIPPIAVLCSLAQGTSRIVGAGRLRIKESDRLHAMAQELTKLGASVGEGEDSLTIHGKPLLNGGTVDAHNDHRIAMSMALAAIRCRTPVTVTGAGSVRKSYPRFWDDFEREEAAIWEAPGAIE